MLCAYALREGPAAPSAPASALARGGVLAGRKTYRVESATCHTDPWAGRRLRVTVTTANRAPATDQARPRLSSGRETPKPWTGVPIREAFRFATLSSACISGRFAAYAFTTRAVSATLANSLTHQASWGPLRDSRPRYGLGHLNSAQIRAASASMER